MKCNNCGREIPDNSTSCPQCGTAVSEVEKTVGIWNGGVMVDAPSSLPTDLGTSQASANVGFGEAIGLFFKKYADFSGRSSKSEFGWGLLFFLIVEAAIIAVSLFVLPFIAVVSLAFLVPMLSLTVRRFHDKSSNSGSSVGASGNNEGESIQDKIYRLSQEHEPRNVNTPDAKKTLDKALSAIVPTYSGEGKLSAAIMLCNPLDIKANIDATDTDSLLVIVKALRHHLSLGDSPEPINMVMKGVMTVLQEKL